MENEQRRQTTLARVLLVAAATLVLAWAGAVGLWGRADDKPAAATVLVADSSVATTAESYATTPATVAQAATPTLAPTPTATETPAPVDKDVLAHARAVVAALGLAGQTGEGEPTVVLASNDRERLGSFVLADRWYRYTFRVDGMLLSLALADGADTVALPTATTEKKQKAQIVRLLAAARPGCGVDNGDLSVVPVETSETRRARWGLEFSREVKRSITGEGLAAWNDAGVLWLLKFGGSFGAKAEEPVVTREQAIATARQSVKERFPDVDADSLLLEEDFTEPLLDDNGLRWTVRLSDKPGTYQSGGHLWDVTVDSFTGAVVDTFDSDWDEIL